MRPETDPQKVTVGQDERTYNCLKHSMKIVVDPMLGDDITSVLHACIKLSSELKVPVEFEFNGNTITVHNHEK